MTPIDFYFDFISPFSYFAWLRLRRREEQGLIGIRPHPVVLGALLDHWGHKGPAEIPPKRDFTWKTCLRFAAREGIRFQFPAQHPFNPLRALRTALTEVAGADQKLVIDTLFRLGWQDGQDLGDDAAVTTALTQAGFDAALLQRKAAEQATKDLLRGATAAAVQRGIFGVPTMVVKDELFWGNDQVETIDAFLTGNDPLDLDQLRHALERPAATERPAAARRGKATNSQE